MCVQLHEKQSDESIRSRIARMECIPLRPLTVRTVQSALAAEPENDGFDQANSAKISSICGLDPGWMLAVASRAEHLDPLTIVEGRPWWPAACSTGAVSDVIMRLWRHSVGVALASRAIARDAGDADPESAARAGLLCRLGWWAMAAIEPEWLLRWWHDDPAARRRREIAATGSDLDDLGRRLAERWGCDDLVIDAAWLSGGHGVALRNTAAEPARLAIIQEACRWVAQTPWSLDGPGAARAMPAEPRLRVLVAEVQALCSTAFVSHDATTHEERLARENARLRLRLVAEVRGRARSDRCLQAMADTDPSCSPQDWASRTATTWCAEPEFSAARVVWLDSERAAREEDNDEDVASPESEPRREPTVAGRPASLVLPLNAYGRCRAFLYLWSTCPGPELANRVSKWTALGAWRSWAALVANRALLERRLQSVVASFRNSAATEQDRLQEQKLDALSEFAAGAGHELNNPLAVVVGRAQLLLARTDEPETARSLRIIINQAGRAHRILRDLMFVARPPEFRRRLCRVSDLLRATLRKFQSECTARGIHLTSEIDDDMPATWNDPDALRNLADILLRNAVEATSNGGKIEVGSRLQNQEVLWWFSDTGRGMAASEAAHLFDPFFCGRQAGRGLGLGLPAPHELSPTPVVDCAGRRRRVRELCSRFMSRSRRRPNRST